MILSQQPKTIVVEGGEYPAPPEKMAMSYAIQALTMAFVITVSCGHTICGWMGREVPEWLKSYQENPWMYCIGAHFFGNAFAASLKNTGAFEIYVDDLLVFSKLETDEMATAYTLQAIFQPYGVNFIRT